MNLAQMRNSDKATVTRVDAAAVLGVDPRTVTEGIRQGNIPAIKIGRRVVIPRLPLLALIEGRAQDPA